MTIDPEKEYSLGEIVQLGVLGKSHHSVSRSIWQDAWQEKDILKAVVTGKGKGTRYKIKGRNLLKYIEMVNKNSI